MVKETDFLKSAEVEKMKQIKALPVIALLSAALLGLAGCGGGGTGGGSNGSGSSQGGKAQTLSIVAYNGGYGTEWLDDICTEFQKETGIVVTYTPDSNILQKIESQLTDTSDYDIYMSHQLDWQNYASRDLIVGLDDLFASSVDNAGEGGTFADRLLDGSAELCRATNDVTKEEHYYKVPFTQGAGGFVYNVDMFKEHNWSVPNTYDELKTLCSTIKTSTNNEVVPFAWSSARDYYWDYPIYEWWCEMDGLESFNAWNTLKDSDGNYAKGYENFNGETKAKSFKKAYQMWYELVGEDSTNSNSKAYNAPLATAQTLFFNGKAAMIPYAQWAKNEIEKATKKTFTFDVAMMPTPTVSASTAKHYNFMVGYGDSMIIGKNSPNIDNAKKFLKFMSTDYACKAFVEKAEGPFLGFDYTNVDLSSIEANSTYIKSLHEILNNSVNFSTWNNNPIVRANGETEVQPWIGNTRYYKEALANPSANSPDTVFTNVYNLAKDNWPTYVRNANVK